LTEFVRGLQLVACAVIVSTAVLPTPRFRISHVVTWPTFEPPSAPPAEDAYVSPAPSVSSTHTAVAVAGPLFVTRISHVTSPPHGIGCPAAGEVWLVESDNVGFLVASANVPTADVNVCPHGFS
jgi:hypothetical protein